MLVHPPLLKLVTPPPPKKNALWSVRNEHNDHPPSPLCYLLHAADTNKDRKLVLSLKLTKEPKNEIRPREVRLQKGPRGLGLNKSARFAKNPNLSLISSEKQLYIII